MIIEKIIPTNSDIYNKWKTFFSLIGEKMDKEGWMQLFAIWTLTVCGIVLSMDIQDRYVYWNWDGWLIGFTKLFIVSNTDLLCVSALGIVKINVVSSNLESDLISSFIPIKELVLSRVRG